MHAAEVTRKLLNIWASALHPAALIGLLLLPTVVLAQTDTSAPPSTDSVKTNSDSATIKFITYVKQFGDSEKTKNIREYRNDSIATRQDEAIELIKSLTLEVQSYLEKGIDTAGLKAEINKIENWYAITSDGVLKNTGTIQTHRNLETSYKIMRELLTRITVRKLSLDQFYKKLVGYRNTIDSLYKEDVLYQRR